MRRGNPLGSKPFPMELHPYAKSSQSGKIALSFDLIMQFLFQLNLCTNAA